MVLCIMYYTCHIYYIIYIYMVYYEVASTELDVELNLARD